MGPSERESEGERDRNVDYLIGRQTRRERGRVKRREDSIYIRVYRKERVGEKVRERGNDTWRGKQGRGDRDSGKRRKGSKEKSREVERDERKVETVCERRVEVVGKCA